MLFQVLFFDTIISLQTELITIVYEEKFPLPFSWSNNQIDMKEINRRTLNLFPYIQESHIHERHRERWNGPHTSSWAKEQEGLPRLGRSFLGWREQMTGSWMYALPYRWGHLDEIYLKNYGNNYYFFWEKFPIWILPGNWRRNNSFEPMGSQLLLVQKSPPAKEAHPGEAYSEPLQNQTENNKIK